MKTKLVCLIIALFGIIIPTIAASQIKPTLTLSSTTVGGTFGGSGCGLKPNVDTFIYLYKQESTAELAGIATNDDSSGCFTFTTDYVFVTASSYSAYVYTVKPNVGPGAYNQNHPVIDMDFQVQ